MLEEKKTTDASNFEKEREREKRKKERIGFAYAHRNIVYLDSLERCHEADVVSFDRTNRVREEKKKIR